MARIIFSIIIHSLCNSYTHWEADILKGLTVHCNAAGRCFKECFIVVKLKCDKSYFEKLAIKMKIRNKIKIT